LHVIHEQFIGSQPRVVPHPVATAKRFSVLIRSLQRPASFSNGNHAGICILEGGRYVLIIDDKHYELADIYSPKVVKDNKELLAKGIKSGEEAGIWEQMIQEM
jgi:hypothetical protein